MTTSRLIRSAVPAPALTTWLQAARPRTLWAAVSPVLVGGAMAWADGRFHPLAWGLALLGAVLIQVGTNFYNDYADFLKGADAERTGPLRVTQAGLVSPETMRRATVLVFALAVGAGLYLMGRGGWPIVAIGFLSILFGVLYTAGRYSLAYLGLADGFVILFFGPVAVAGTYYVQALQLPPEVIVAGFGPGLLANAILLVNNLRDQAGDARVGKKTLVVRLGRTFGVLFYAGCVVGAALVPVYLWLRTGAHPWAMLAALVVPLAVPNLHLLWRQQDPATLNPVLGRTALLLLAWSLLFAIGWNL
jgi:1,4-dihydroxy-2-naphthoate octaprenyltransferase